jgi:hypothetical protein
MRRLTLAIDFDNTIAVNKYPQIGELMPGAKKFVNKLYEDGHFIVINTCRTGREEKEAAIFLFENRVKFHLINQNNPQLILTFGEDCRKISADIYVDDKNLGGLPPWEEIYERITKFANGTWTASR